MILPFSVAFVNIRIMIKQNPTMLSIDPDLERFIEPRREMSILPEQFVGRDFNRIPHARKLQEICRRYDQYHDIFLVLEFVLGNYFLYPDLMALDESILKRKKTNYRQDLQGVYQFMSEIQAGVERYRNTHSEDCLEVELYYPISIPPTSKPDISKLQFPASF